MSFLSKSLHSLLVIQLVLVINYGSTDVLARKHASTGQVPPYEMEKIKQYLETINKPAVKSIKSPEGDVIDCVHIDKQPALDNPLLKNHNIQMVPPTMPTYRGGNSTLIKETVRQAWNNVGHCLKGTVPIRRITAEDVLRVGSLSQFGKKKRNLGPRSARVPPYDNDFALAVPQDIYSIYGTVATFNIWNPYVEAYDEFSNSRLLLRAYGSSYEVIEAGWQVFPKLYGDSNTRLFIYWTSDGYQSTGCYDLSCPGFVQISNIVYPGMVLPFLSTYDGPQRCVEGKFQDPNGNWLLFCENLYVGYWPAELFTQLSSYATWLDWGGEIANTRPYFAHTGTAMGSGHFSSEGYSKACYIRNFWTVDSEGYFNLVQSILPYGAGHNCYDAISYNDPNLGFLLYFGGPGRTYWTPLCT